MMGAPRDQAGTTLVIALAMLVVIALLAANAVNDSTVDLRIVSNMQSQQDVAAALQDAIEQAISDKTLFSLGQARTIAISRPDYGDTLSVQIAAPVCRQSTPSEGYSAVLGTGSPTEQTTWEVVASARDPLTGARAEIHQGVALLLRTGACPTPAATEEP